MAGLGGLLSNPLTGQIMVLRFKGRKTGRTRYAPVNYAVIDGKIYCYQGKRLKGQWYLSLMADPKVEALLPRGPISGFSERVTVSRERVDSMRQILKNSGLGGLIHGFDPRTAPDDLILEKIEGINVVRITPFREEDGSYQEDVSEQLN